MIYMAIPGVKFEPKYEDIVNAIKKYDGIITNIANHFGVWRGTMAKYLTQNPEFNLLVQEAREEMMERRLDEAEETLFILNKMRDEEPAVALKASQYLLNNQGRKRNYNHPEVEAARQSVGMLDKAQNLKVLPPNDS
jgi:hypothetical protein